MKLINLKTDLIGRNLIFYQEIDSTQNEIWRLIQNNHIKNGMLVMADIQTKGKGTHGRIWHTDEWGNIAFSFYIETNCNIDKLKGLTIEIAHILVDIFKEEYNINLSIKTPNDLILNHKKIGGILTESKMSSEVVKFLVIGIGINTTKLNFTEDIENIATSIKKECGIEIDRTKIISIFCNRFEERIKRRYSL